MRARLLSSHQKELIGRNRRERVAINTVGQSKVGDSGPDEMVLTQVQRHEIIQTSILSAPAMNEEAIAESRGGKVTSRREWRSRRLEASESVGGWIVLVEVIEVLISKSSSKYKDFPIVGKSAMITSPTRRIPLSIGWAQSLEATGRRKSRNRIG